MDEIGRWCRRLERCFRDLPCGYEAIAVDAATIEIYPSGTLDNHLKGQGKGLSGWGIQDEPEGTANVENFDVFGEGQ